MMNSHAEPTPADDVLPRCGALVLDALLANDGITGVELDPKDNSLALRYDPRRTSRDRVEAVANLLRPALHRPETEQHPDRAHFQVVGRLGGKPYLVPATALQRVGRISIQPDRVTMPHAAPAAQPSAAAPPAPEGAATDTMTQAEATQTDKDNAFLLKVVQPGLVGLMDGSVSTLAPLFAAAFATHNHTQTLLVGLAAAVGAAISMGFAEALSDDGVLTGRGHPIGRGAITGGMTFVGGVGHALPFLIANLTVALTLAYIVVGIELIAISLIRTKYFGARFILSAIQVVVGGALVFVAGVLIGNA
jgi:VIT1/CCC1 family predicted Fe2+/Mn2+ transporter